jgi:hypothetical protein
MKSLLAALLVVASFTGCAVYTPDGAVVVGNPGAPAPAAKHCPPGQAKKGNC